MKEELTNEKLREAEDKEIDWQRSEDTRLNSSHTQKTRMPSSA